MLEDQRNPNIVFLVTLMLAIGTDAQNISMGLWKSTFRTETWNVSAQEIRNGTGSGGEITPRGIVETIFICIVCCTASLATTVGNGLVILSFILNKQVRTWNNYFILNLASADFLIGTISMNLFTINVVLKEWTLGRPLCSIWLTLDYVASNASVMNLLLICLDRYYSVTKPLKYRKLRCRNAYLGSIAAAWIISCILWAPAINAWPYFAGKWTVPENKCYIQFIADSHTVTLVTAVLAFYLPAAVMVILYWRVIVGIKRQEKKMSATNGLANGRKQNSSERNGGIFGVRFRRGDGMTTREWILRKFRGRNESESTNGKQPSSHASPNTFFQPPHTIENTGIETSPRSDEGPVKAVITAEESFSGKEEDTLKTDDKHGASHHAEPTNRIQKAVQKTSRKLPGNPRHTKLKHYALPTKFGRKLPTTPKDQLEGNLSICEDGTNLHAETETNGGNVDDEKEELARHTNRSIVREETHQLLVTVQESSGAPDRKILPDRLPNKETRHTSYTECEERKTLSKEAKAARLLASILLAFIILWLPYNILAVIHAYCEKTNCVPDELWNLGYFLCYLNSTLNPVLYALCNNSFKHTFKFILSLKFLSREERRRLNRASVNSH